MLSGGAGYYAPTTANDGLQKHFKHVHMDKWLAFCKKNHLDHYIGREQQPVDGASGNVPQLHFQP